MFCAVAAPCRAYWVLAPLTESRSKLRLPLTANNIHVPVLLGLCLDSPAAEIDRRRKISAAENPPSKNCV